MSTVTTDIKETAREGSAPAAAPPAQKTPRKWRRFIRGESAVASVGIAAAAILFAFGLYRLFRSHHPNWVGMRVGFRDLTLWSFVMASAHGAGLMLIPLFLSSPPQAPAAEWAMTGHTHAGHGLEFANFNTPSLLASSVAVHTLGYLLATGLVAILVYERFGVGILRHAWFNVDIFWMLALMITGLLILVL